MGETEKWMKHRIIFNIMFLILYDTLFAAIYYVNNQHPSASDQNPGSMNLPFMTVQKGIDSAEPGDTIRVMEGSYGTMLCRQSGSEDHRITIAGDLNGTTLVKGIEFSNSAAYVDVSYFTVRDFDIWGVFLHGNNHHIRLNQLHVIGGESGIRLTYGYRAQDPEEGPVTDIVIENSEIQDCQYTAVDGTPGPCNRIVLRNLSIHGAGLAGGGSWGSDGIGIERGSTIIVEDCEIYDNAGDGIDLNSRDFQGEVNGNYVRCNHVYRNHRNGIKLWGGGLMENNLIWGQGDTPVVLGDFPGKYDVINNTIAYNMWDSGYAGRNYAFLAAYPNDETGLSASVRLTMINNIFAFNCNDVMDGPTGLYLGGGVQLIQECNNIYWSREDGEIQAEFLKEDPWVTRTQIHDGTWTTLSAQGDGDITANPLFISGWPNVDLHLDPLSPAIDRGSLFNAPLVDFSGNARPSGDSIDIGAYEFVQGNRVNKMNTDCALHCSLYPAFPNPCNHRMVIRYSLSRIASVRLKILNNLGQLCDTLYDGSQHPGDHVCFWTATDANGKPLPSGFYIVYLQAGQSYQINKFILLN